MKKPFEIEWTDDEMKGIRKLIELGLGQILSHLKLGNLDIQTVFFFLLSFRGADEEGCPKCPVDLLGTTPEG